MPKGVEADLLFLCNEDDNDSLEKMLKRAEEETKLQSFQVG